METNTETNMEISGETSTETNMEVNGEINMETNTETDGEINGETGMEINEETNGETGMEISGETNAETDEEADEKATTEVGQVLAELRSERGVYQKELAVYLNVSIGTISNYEKGVHYPDLVTLGKLADFFGVTTDFLLGRTEYRYNPDTLNHPLIQDYTVASLVNTALELSQNDRGLLADYVGLLKLRQTINAARRSD